ncbi:MAG: hypothetical protein WBW04_13145 [Nitrolancea sp.]
MSESQPSARDAEVDARYQSLAHRYANRFDAAAEEKIRNDIGRLVDAALTLRQFTLANGDEPDFTFHSKRRDG